MARVPDEDELIEHWTLVGDELDLLAGRTGPSKLGLALWLKFFIMKGCFPAGRSELPDEAVGWVASQVKVPASDLGLFDWEGRTAERARKTVRTFLGFRECSVAYAEKLTTWLADEVCSRERHAQRVREALLARLREEQIEQPSRIRLGRMIGSALRQSEETLTAKDHPGEVRWTLMAAYLHCREREITDGLVELLIATVHRINARAETRTREQFVADIAKKVTGKENILFSIAAAAAGKPQGIVEEVV